MEKRKFYVATLALALLLAGCTSSRPAEPTPQPLEVDDILETTDSTTSMPVPAPGNEGVDEMIVDDKADMEDAADDPVDPPTTNQVREFKVEAKQFEFIPSTITVNQGDTVKLHVTSTDVDHGLAIPEYNINTTIKAGTTETIEFVADKKGSFKFMCSIFCGSGHRDMTGTLVVE